MQPLAFPQPFASTVSHWQATNRGSTSLYNHGKDARLPSTADIVIIGAGMTGASLAYQLTRPGAGGDDKSIIVLEAKDVASGATGRNGGHVRPASFLAYPGLVKPLREGGAGVTSAEAVEILEDEEENMRLVSDIVEREKLNDGAFGGVEWKSLESLVVYRTAEERDLAKAALTSYQAAREKHGLSPQPGIHFVDDPEEAKKITRVTSAVACSSTIAGAVHPHKLATALLRLALQSSSSQCELHSWTPVECISREAQGWNVKTSKGGIRAAKVVIASNAYTQYLWNTQEIPFSNLITTNRGHACLITPPANYSGVGTPPHSIVFGGTYLREVAGDGFVMGCGGQTLRDHDLAKPEDYYDTVDDSYVIPKVEQYFSGVLSKTYEGWKEAGRGEGMTRVWSGIIGYSRDKLPFIGPMPGQDGLFAAVAFHGHGMSRILCCTRALAKQMSHPSCEWDPRLPRTFEITTERIQRALTAPPIYTKTTQQNGNSLEVADPPPQAKGIAEDNVPRPADLKA